MIIVLQVTNRFRTILYIKETIFLSNCKGLRLYKYYTAILVTIRLAGFMVGHQGKRREELRSDHVEELAVVLNSEATKEEIRNKGKYCSINHEQENLFRKKCASRSTKKVADGASLPPTVRIFTIRRSEFVE